MISCQYYVMLSKKEHTFQISVLVQFFVNSACFEHHVFIIRKKILSKLITRSTSACIETFLYLNLIFLKGQRHGRAELVS